MNQRLTKQFQFLLEADRLKTVERRSYLSDGSRRENSAEHSWHLALAILLLGEYFKDGKFDVLRAVKMAILHDIVEIEAGDTFVYDQEAQQSREQREKEAADHLFGLLPDDQASDFRALWEEFEARQSNEAQLAGSLDRVCPILLNLSTGGRSWREHGVGRQQVEEFNLPALDATPAVRDHLVNLLKKAEQEGIFGSQSSADRVK